MDEDLIPAWLHCHRVLEGMFSTEFVVVFEKFGGEEVSFFVEKDKVREKDKLLSVYIDKPLGNGSPYRVALIPTPQPETIAVKQADLRSRSGHDPLQRRNHQSA